MKFTLKEDGKRFFVICAAAVILAANIATFVRVGNLYPGGVTGLAILIQRVADVYFHVQLPYTPISLALNAIPIYIGFRFIGKKFTLYSCVVIVLSGILTDLIPKYAITYDPLLISVFGGIISGAAVSMCLQMNATTGGTDFIAIYLSEKKGVDSWNLILFINVGILCVAGLLFGWEKALYSIIFQYTSTQILHILYQKYQRKTLFIVTDHAAKICDVIYQVSGHGATILDGKGSYENATRSIVYSVVSSAESKKVIRAIRDADDDAFVNAIRTEQLTGRFYNKPTE